MHEILPELLAAADTRGDRIVVENTHEAIIGKDIWPRVQQKIASGKSPRVTKK